MTWKLKLNRSKITHKELKSTLKYDPVTGLWSWNRTFTNRSKKQKGDIIGTQTHGYVVIRIKKRKYYAHILAWFYMTKSWPRVLIDHKDTNGLNNKWDNLREATHNQNHYNTPTCKNNKTGYKGIHFEKQTGKYRASIRVEGNTIKSKRVNTLKEAVIIYNEMHKLHGEFARK